MQTILILIAYTLIVLIFVPLDKIGAVQRTIKQKLGISK